MGLDMFLYKKDKKGKMLDNDLYYWRKANQIRNWLVEHIEEFDYSDNCKEFVVPEDTIKQLVSDIKQVLDNHELASEIMPTSSGFFFGYYEYDEWYFEQLQQTYDDLKLIIANFDFEKCDIVYYEWW